MNDGDPGALWAINLEPPATTLAAWGFQAACRQHRPVVERAIAWLTRGNRKRRYRCVANNDLWLHHPIAALNLRRLLAPRPHPTKRGMGVGLNSMPGLRTG